MNFVLLASSMSKELGQAFLILAFSTDTAVTAVVLSLLVTISKKYGTFDIRKLTKLEEKEKASEEGA
jgi:NADH:ubiquinone oxidoreductase subunit K